MPKNTNSRIGSNEDDVGGSRTLHTGTNGPRSHGLSPEEIPFPMWRPVILKALRQYPEFSPSGRLFDELEDVAQDTIARLLRTLQHRGVNIAGAESATLTLPEPYIVRAAKHTFIDYSRRLSDKERLTHVSLPEMDDNDNQDVDEFVARNRHEPLTDRSVFDQALVGAMWDQIEEIITSSAADPRTATLIVRLALAGYSYTEIAVNVGVSEVRVSNVMNRIRRKLAKEHPEWAKGRRLRGPQRGRRTANAHEKVEPET